MGQIDSCAEGTLADRERLTKTLMDLIRIKVLVRPGPVSQNALNAAQDYRPLHFITPLRL